MVALAQVISSLLLGYKASSIINLMQTEVDSEVSVLSNGCGDSGREVREGQGSWVHWASFDQARLEALKRQAIENLETKYGVEPTGGGHSVASVRRHGRKKRASVFLKFGWKHYTSFNLDFEDGYHDAIVSYLTRRQIGLRNFDTVLALFDELATFLTAKSVFRLAFTSRVRWTNRQARPLRVMKFVVSEALPDRPQLYPAAVSHIGIIFDKQLTMQICYEHFFYLQDCVQLQTLTVTLEKVPSEYQLLDFQSLLIEYLRLLLEDKRRLHLRRLLQDKRRLRLVLKFPHNSRRHRALCTGHSILHHLDIDVVIVWRKAFLNRRFISHWASEG